MKKTFNAADYFIFNSPFISKERIAFYYEEQVITYQDLYNNVAKYISFLKNVNVKRQDKVGIILEDCPEFIYMFWALIRIEAIPILINSRFQKSVIEKTIESSGVKIVISSRDLNTGINENNEIIFVEDINLEVLIPYAEFHCEAETEEDDVAFGIYTSGSKGVPKCVLHDHKGMKLCAEYYYKDTLNIDEHDIVYSASKMMHTYGLGNSNFQVLGVGAASVISKSDNVFGIMDNIATYKPTVFYAIPSIYKGILSAVNIKEHNLSSVRLFFSAGEKLTEHLYNAWMELFQSPIYDGLGNTEYLTTFLTNKPGDCRIGSCGRKIKGFDAVIMNERGEVPVNEVGLLYVRSDICFKGYLNDTDSQKYWKENLYYNTENRCYKDEDGFIWYVGRNNELFKKNGRWINAHEVEDCIINFDRVEDALVIGIEDDSIMLVHCYISLTEQPDNYDDYIWRLKVYLKRNLEHYKCPSYFYIVKEFPLGYTNKKIRKEISGDKILYQSPIREKRKGD